MSVTGRAERRVSTIVRPHRWLGRVEDVARLTGLLLDEKVRAIAVLGPGGIGKTSLTKRVATEDPIATRFVCQWFVSLETAEGSAGLELAIAKSLGLDPSARFDAVLARLAGEPGLLVLDNLETPWEHAPEETEELLVRLLNVEGVVLLASMRGTMAPAEPRWFTHCVGPLGTAKSETLFREFAPRISAGDPHLRVLLRELGGMPLAIRLVAQRAAGFSSLNDLWAEWRRQGTELAADPDRAATRLTSVARSIAFSLGSPRLRAGGMRLFRLLGQLPAGITRRHRDALLKSASFEAAQQLLAVGLAYDRAGRLDLLPPMRDFARREHPPNGPDAENWVTHILAELKFEAGKMYTQVGSEVIARLTPEFPNIDAAMRAARTEPLRCDAISASLAYSTLCAAIGQKGDALRPLIAYCRATGNTIGEANCTYGLAKIAYHRSDMRCLEIYRTAVALYRQIGDAFQEAMCAHGIAEAEMSGSNYEAARENYSGALQLLQKLREDDKIEAITIEHTEAHCIMGLAQIAHSLGDYAAAREGYDAALAWMSHTRSERSGVPGCYRSFDRCVRSGWPAT